MIATIFGSKNKSDRARRGRYKYQDGYLSLDFVEPNSNRLIWHGTAKAELDFKYSPEESEKVIKEVVEKILDNYPPKAK